MEDNKVTFIRVVNGEQVKKVTFNKNNSVEMEVLEQYIFGNTGYNGHVSTHITNDTVTQTIRTYN